MPAKNISVVIPTFNRADLVERCLQSLVSFEIDELEIIVVDDGGTDRTPDVVAAFPGAIYLRQENAGPAQARNHGFAASHGRYVCFIDSDDEWINGGGTRLAAQLDANPDVPVIFADAAMGNETTGFVSFVTTYGGSAFAQLPGDQRDGVRVLERGPFFRQLSTRNVMFLGSMLFRRQAFEAVRGFDSRLRGAADWDLFMRVTIACKVAFSKGPPTSRYYKHDSAMSTDSDHMDREFIAALDSVRRRCALQPEERAHVDRRLREQVFGWAYGAYNNGDFPLARRRLQLSKELGTAGLRERTFLAATYMPVPIVRALRRVKRTIGLLPDC
jgi:glycosyltransferase involved in cell wall biosynthesis